VRGRAEFNDTDASLMKARRKLKGATPVNWPEIRAGCFAKTIRSDSPEGCRLALLGLPDDTGIKLNGGRPGAKEGPRAFRAALAAYGTTWDALHRKQLSVPVFDAGDVMPVREATEKSMLATHAGIERVVLQLHELGLTPVCIGGGHDLSLPAISALSRHQGMALGGIVFDAHLDARQRPGSGMAFRRLIENKQLDSRRFASVGLGRFANDEADWTWLENQGATLIPAERVLEKELPIRALFERAFKGGVPGFVSIDLDGLDSSVAPGVSALNPMGLSVRQAASLAEAAGADPRARYFDLMELSPPHDESGRTARIAALLFLSFVAGFARRP
jgi:formimidoylglutamase